MSQHDLSIANQGFPAFRSDLNDALQALGSMQSGTSAPATTYANMLWYDTTNNIVKMRNEDNDAWISLFTLDQVGDLVSEISVGKLIGTDTTDASSTTAAAVKTAGGLAVAKKLYVGSDSVLNGLTVGKGAGSVATNTAVGASALAANTTGDRSTAVGNNAALTNTTGVSLTALGYNAAKTANAKNTAVGAQTMQLTTTGNSNVAVGGGDSSAELPTFYSNTTGSNNTAVGWAGLASNTTGSNNTAVGYGAGALITTGNKNSIIGNYSGNQGGLDIRTASNYVVLSDGDGNPYAYWNQGAYTSATFKATGNDQWLTLTSSAAAFSTTLFLNAAGGGSGVVKSGARLICYAGNQETNGVYLANGSSTSWASTSDERFKTDLKPIENSLSKVDTLRSVTGRFKTDEESTSRSFLIAQDVLAVFPEAVDATDPDKLGVQYSDTIPLLVAAIKELNAKVDAQAAEIAALKGQA